MRATILATLVLASAADARPRVAQNQDRDEEENEGPEAEAVLRISLDDLIEVAVRLAPDLNRARIDRSVARDLAEGERRNQAWMVTSTAEYKRNALAENVDAPPYSIVAQDRISGAVGIGRNLPTGGNVSVEAGVAREKSEYLIVTRLRDTLAQAPAG